MAARSAVFALLVCASLAFARRPEEKPGTALDRVESFVDSVLAGKMAAPEAWPAEAEARLLDVNALAETEFDPGVAYAVSVTKEIPYSYARVRDLLGRDGAIYLLVSKVKTHRKLEKVRETQRELRLKLAIRVPILPDFETQDDLVVTDDGAAHGSLSWRQYGGEGHLAFNRGAVTVDAQGDHCRVRVIAVHVLKPEHRIPWYGRGQADSFTREHYANYIVALEDVLAGR